MKKLLMIGDAGCRTGFARVVKAVADRLHATGKWDISVRGINWNERHGIDYAYDVQPITFGGSDPIAAATIPYHVEEARPDAIWCLQDPWHLQPYAVEKPRDLPSVCYVPVDTPCIKWEHGLSMAAWSQVCSYTRFGAREMAAAVQDGFDVLFDGVKSQVPNDGKTRWIKIAAANHRNVEIRLDRLARVQNPEAWNIIPHGRPDAVFQPRDRAACRREFGIPEDGFVVGMVGGNQVRKRLDMALRAFAMFAESRPEALFVVHCWGDTTQEGWDLASLSRFYGISDRILAVHWAFPELSDDQLCSLYNSFDVLLNTSSGEGWGLPATEAAACGVPQVVTDWAALREIWSEHALLVPVLDYIHFERYLNTAHAVVDVKAAAKALAVLHGDPGVREAMARKALARVADLPTWDEVGDGFDVILGKALEEGPPVPTSLNDVRTERRARVVSSILEQP